MKNRLSYSEWGKYFSVNWEKAKAIAFGASRKIKVMKELNTLGKMKHHGKYIMI